MGDAFSTIIQSICCICNTLISFFPRLIALTNSLNVFKVKEQVLEAFINFKRIIPPLSIKRSFFLLI